MALIRVAIRVAMSRIEVRVRVTITGRIMVRERVGVGERVGVTARARVRAMLGLDFSTREGMRDAVVRAIGHRQDKRGMDKKVRNTLDASHYLY